MTSLPRTREKLLKATIAKLPNGASVLDVGAGDGALLSAIHEQRPDLRLFACDIQPMETQESKAEFKAVDLSLGELPYEDDQFGLVLCAHVLEHLPNGPDLYREMVRLTEPGGYLYVECPSERSVWPSPWYPQHWNLILSFYDDPTHVGRPWSPQSLRRLAFYNGIDPILSNYDFSLLRLLRLPFDWAWGVLMRDPDHLVDSWWIATGWVAYCIARKPDSVRGQPEYHYFTFKGRRIGPLYDHL